MYSEDDLLPVSALQHFIFCPRQCALIHIEQLWEDNRFTAEGRIMHEKVHDDHIETRKSIRVERGMPIRSFVLGLIGKTDVVEFHKSDNCEKLVSFPIEYKRGKPKPDDCDKVQLCAQALCMEEMTGVTVDAGAIFYGKTRRRFDVVFDNVLRDETKETAGDLHKFIDEGKTPPPKVTEKCKACSLVEMCLPEVLERNTKIDDYLEENLQL